MFKDQRPLCLECSESGWEGHEILKIVRGQVMQRSVSCIWKLEFNSGWDEKVLEDFKQSHMILFILKKSLVVIGKIACTG